MVRRLRKLCIIVGALVGSLGVVVRWLGRWVWSLVGSFVACGPSLVGCGRSFVGSLGVVVGWDVRWLGVVVGWLGRWVWSFVGWVVGCGLYLIHISEPTRLRRSSYVVFSFTQ